jgi:hypothetical protein
MAPKTPTEPNGPMSFTVYDIYSLGPKSSKSNAFIELYYWKAVGRHWMAQGIIPLKF